MHDIQKEQKRLDEKKIKQKKIRKAFDAEDDDEEAEAALLSECVDKCEKEAWSFLFFCMRLYVHIFFSVE